MYDILLITLNNVSSSSSSAYQSGLGPQYHHHHYYLLHIRVAWAASREDLSHIIPPLPIADSHRHDNALFVSSLSSCPCLNKFVILGQSWPTAGKA